MKTIKKIGVWISGPKLLHWTLPVLMIYLIAGTIAQKYIGLYQATEIFFTNPLLWLGDLPLPGLPIWIGLLFLNLLCHLIVKTRWRLQNLGTIIAHIGALLLLLGGLFTALSTEEGYIDFAEGETRSYISDYHMRALAITDEQNNIHARYDHESLQLGQTIKIPSTEIQFKILEYCENCDIVPRQPSPDKTYFGMAQHMQLEPKAPEMKNEENLAGLTIELSGSDNDGVYVLLEHVPRSPVILIKDQPYKFILRKKQRPLPFQITLRDFQKEDYPGTQMAKFYESNIALKHGTGRWENTIRMNEPLRYKGYTFYQTSYIEGENETISVLTAVKNKGRIFPYLSGILMCVGLLLHLILRDRNRQAQYA